MKTTRSSKVTHLIYLHSCLLSLSLWMAGCGKDNKGSSKTLDAFEARLESIRQAEQPATLVELQTWYVEPAASENAAALYLEAFAALTPAKADESGFLGQNQKALTLLHQAAAREKSRYPVDWTAGLTVPLPHLANVKKCAQLLEKDALSHVAKGRMDLAAQSILDGLRLSQSMVDEPLLLSQLVRIAAETIAHNTLRQALEKRSFPEDQLVLLAKAFQGIENGQAFGRCLIGERCFGISLFQLPAAEQAGLLEKMAEKPGDTNFEAYRKTPAFADDAGFYLDCMEGYITAAGLPFPAGLEAASLVHERIAEAKTKGHLISAVFLPAFSTLFEKDADAAARQRISPVVLAVEQYRRANQNALPESLDQLVPKFLAAVPVDPYDGKPMRYAKTPPKGYALYSIGKDRKDDGGKPTPAKGTALDLVFAVPR